MVRSYEEEKKNKQVCRSRDERRANGGGRVVLNIITEENCDETRHISYLLAMSDLLQLYCDR